MKRGFLASILVLLLMIPAYSAANFSVSFTGNYLSPSDSNFKDTYGSGVFFPELKLNYKVFNNISLWAGFGLLSKTGETPGLGEEAKSSQNIISFGVGYSGDFNPKFGYKVEVGAAYFSYKEEAMETEISDSAFGFRGDFGIVYNITATFFAEITAGYMSASDTLTVLGEDVDIDLGGFKAGIGVGIKF